MSVGLVKAKVYNIADSNIANLGTELEKNVRAAAARSEPSWDSAGQEAGLQIWRIEKFHVIAWPTEKYGQFHTGDSYIVLKTLKNSDGTFRWDIHFCLGKHTSQDEAGTAAYKTVELDDRLGTAPIQHRETQGHESHQFQDYFPKGVVYLAGGIDSGFNHVKPEEYTPRLLRVKGRRTVQAAEVSLTRESLNSGDVFILDAGLKLYQFNGSRSSGGERMKAGQLCRAIDEERRGLAQVIVFEEGDKDIPAPFWEMLGGEGPIHSAEEGGSDDLPPGGKRLLRLSDASGALEMTVVSEGRISRSALTHDDVYIFDTGFEVFAWVGNHADPAEKRNALQFAHDYLIRFGRPPQCPITRIRDGGENEVFTASFDS